MTFQEAAAYIMPLGKHYLDWLIGIDLRSARLKEALRVYLTDPSIQKELENLR